MQPAYLQQRTRTCFAALIASSLGAGCIADSADSTLEPDEQLLGSHDATVARDLTELHAMVADQMKWMSDNGHSELAQEAISIEFRGRGDLVRLGPSATPPEPPEEKQHSDERAAPIASWIAFNPVTKNEFEIRVPQTVLRTIHETAARTGLSSGSGDIEGRGVPAELREVQDHHEAGGTVGKSWSGGVDNRTVRAPTTTWPWRTISHFSNGCTGTLVGPRHLVTAAHCINQAGTNNWFDFTVTPGRDGNAQPFGSVAMSDDTNPGDPFRWYFTPSPWRAASTPSGGRSQYDFGIIIIPARLGDNTGWMGFVTRGADDLQAAYNINRGYPSCELPNRIDEPVPCQPRRLYGQSADCVLGEFSNQDADGWSRRVRHSCDASAGQSGSPLYHYFHDPNLGEEVPVVAMVHTTSFKCANVGDPPCNAADVRPLGATRITVEYRDWISYFRSWRP